MISQLLLAANAAILMALLTVVCWKTLSGSGPPRHASGQAWPILVGVLWGYTLPLNADPKLGAPITACIVLTSLHTVFRRPRVRLIASTIIALLGAGILIALFRHFVEGYDVVGNQLRGTLIGGLVMLLLVLHFVWSSDLIGWQKTAFVYFASSCAFILLQQWVGVPVPNVWKYSDLHMVLPMLAAVLAGRHYVRAALSLGALAVLSMFVFDTRSVTAALALSALLCMPWTTGWFARLPRVFRWLAIAVAGPLALVGGQWVLLKLARADILDADLTATVTNQAALGAMGDRVGLLLGIGFLMSLPLGLGIGVRIDDDTANAVLSFLPEMPTSDAFVMVYMLGGNFGGVPRVHSGWGDLIVWAGVIGLVVALLTCMLLVAVLDGTVTASLDPNARPLALVAVLLSCWHLFGGAAFTPTFAVVCWLWAGPYFWVAKAPAPRVRASGKYTGQEDQLHETWGATRWQR